MTDGEGGCVHKKKLRPRTWDDYDDKARGMMVFKSGGGVIFCTSLTPWLVRGST